jgi:dCMP deaminase
MMLKTCDDKKVIEKDNSLKEHKFMMDIAQRVADESYDYKTRVGAVISKDRNILAYGYNGTVAGSDNTMRDPNGFPLCTVVHAEQNAIAKLAKSTQSGEGATLYTTLFPCMSCALSIIQSGITKVIYKKRYKKNEALKLLVESGVQVFQIY